MQVNETQIQTIKTQKDFVGENVKRSITKIIY